MHISFLSLPLSSQSVVWETPHIRKGFLSESTEPGEEGLWRLKTDGVNLQVTAGVHTSVEIRYMYIVEPL